MGKDYDDIPGTNIFDTMRCKQGFHLNKFCKSLDQSENRDEFRKEPGAYLDQYPMNPEQRRIVEERDWLGMLQVGGNIYYTFKLAIFDGYVPVRQWIKEVAPDVVIFAMQAPKASS